MLLGLSVLFIKGCIVLRTDQANISIIPWIFLVNLLLHINLFFFLSPNIFLETTLSQSALLIILF